MKTLARNTSPFYYALYDRKEEIANPYGYTGETKVLRKPITYMRGNISAARGTADLEDFGVNLNYTKTIVIDKIDCPIDEVTVLWLDFGVIENHDEDILYLPQDLVIYDGKIYRCKNETVGNFNPSDWSEVPYNYVVVGVAKSLNHIRYAVRKVDVS